MAAARRVGSLLQWLMLLAVLLLVQGSQAYNDSAATMAATETSSSSSSWSNSNITSGYLYDASSKQAPQWMIDFMAFRKRLFLRTVEPVIVFLLGPGEETSGTSSTTEVVELHSYTATNNHADSSSYTPDYDPELSKYTQDPYHWDSFPTMWRM